MIVTLHGITWNHTRGFMPMVATAQRFEELHPQVNISWEKRSLQSFGDDPISKLAEEFDLLVIDHPSIGEAASSLLPLDAHLSPGYLTAQAFSSVGRSHESYTWQNRQWALAIDAAAPVSSWRQDLLDEMRVAVPEMWPEVLELAKGGVVAVPLTPVDALMTFYMFCGAAGEEPFSQPGRVAAEEVKLAALAHLSDLARLCGEESLQRNPIATYEAMTRSDRIAYCPFAYGYSNYARPGYAPKLLCFGKLAKMRDGRRLRSTLGGAGLAVSRRCLHVPLAAEYACFVAGAACQCALYFTSGGQPGYRAAWEDPALNAACNNFFADTLCILDEAYLRPRFSGYLPFQHNAALALHQFLRTGGDPRLVCNELEQLFRNVKQ
jgi:multiple sugar transport system substrate-binding protein